MPTLPYIVRVILKTSHFSERTLLLTSGPLVPGGLAEGLQPPFSLKKATLKLLIENGHFGTGRTRPSSAGTWWAADGSGPELIKWHNGEEWT